MKEIKEAVIILIALGYEPDYNEENKDIFFKSHGFDSFPQRHKKVMRAILGKKFREFYYGSDTQHIYCRNIIKDVQPVNNSCISH
jgi:hypothetical protein